MSELVEEIKMMENYNLVRNDDVDKGLNILDKCSDIVSRLTICEGEKEGIIGFIDESYKFKRGNLIINFTNYVDNLRQLQVGYKGEEVLRVEESSDYLLEDYVCPYQLILPLEDHVYSYFGEDRWIDPYLNQPIKVFSKSNEIFDNEWISLIKVLYKFTSTFDEKGEFVEKYREKLFKEIMSFEN